MKPAKHDSIPTRHSLLNRLKDWRDEASWREFFETYWELIYNVARKAGLNDAEAQDVVQETVIAVAKRKQITAIEWRIMARILGVNSLPGRRM